MMRTGSAIWPKHRRGTCGRCRDRRRRLRRLALASLRAGGRVGRLHLRRLHCWHVWRRHSKALLQGPGLLARLHGLRPALDLGVRLRRGIGQRRLLSPMQVVHVHLEIVTGNAKQ